jgi:hypothetical protein
MAVRKLPPSLFTAKARDMQSKDSGQIFHFVAAATRGRNQFALVCQSQPLMTFRSYGFPARCPACGAQIHFKENYEC